MAESITASLGELSLNDFPKLQFDGPAIPAEARITQEVAVQEAKNDKPSIENNNAETNSTGGNTIDQDLSSKKYKFLVLDTNPLLRGDDLYPYADRFVTIPEVIDEIVSKQARDRLEFVKIKLNLETMHPESKYIAQVVKKAKETGDFNSLSITDIKVIALALMLETQHRTEQAPRVVTETETRAAGSKNNDVADVATTVTTEQENCGPKNNKQSVSGYLASDQKAKNVDDFFMSAPDGNIPEIQDDDDEIEAGAEAKVKDQGVEHDAEMEKAEHDPIQKSAKSPNDDESSQAIGSSEQRPAEEKGAAAETGRNSDEVANEDDDDDDDDGGENGWSVVSKPKKTRRKPKFYNNVFGWGGEWITPENVSEAKMLGSSNVRNIKAAIKERSLAGDGSADSQIFVGSVTSDFAMQNTLLNLGLKLVSLDGFLIRELKTWVMRCHACYATTPKMDAQFCNECGHPTLIRTSVSSKPVVNKNSGSGDDQPAATVKTRVYLKKNFKYNLQGTKFSIPAPKGGRNNKDIITRADDKLYLDSMDRRNILLSKMERQQLKGDDGIWDVGYMPNMLTGTQNSSKGKNGERFDARGMPVIGFGRKNPNKAKKTGNRKNKNRE